jgi:hypothetical protein
MGSCNNLLKHTETKLKDSSMYFLMFPDVLSELRSFYSTRLSHLRPVPWLQDEVVIDLEQAYVQLYLQNRCV